MSVQSEQFIQRTVKEFEVALRQMIDNNHCVHLFTIGVKDGVEYGLLVVTGTRTSLDSFMDLNDFARHLPAIRKSHD
jgi:hypothetical protein